MPVHTPKEISAPLNRKEKSRRRANVAAASMFIDGDDPDNPEYNTPEYESYEDDETKPMEFQEDFSVDTYDAYVTAQVLLPKGDDYVLGTVQKRKRDTDGNLIGRGDNNPILDTRLYEVEFQDGEVLEYAANVIAEHLYSQVDDEGNQQVMMDSIIDHKRDGSAILKDDEFIEVNGRKSRRKSTVGWKLCVQWKDGSTSWESLSALKESYPIEVTEYADNKIASEPAFSWWVPYTL
mgnify:FL=1